MENLLVHKLIGNGSKINEVLPPELLKKIMENLGFKSLVSALQSCKYWKGIIDAFELQNKALRKCLDLSSTRLILLKIVFIFRENILHSDCWG